MQEALPWLSQGDVFREVPILRPGLDLSAEVVEIDQSRGPALLITHGCTIDKASNSGRSTNKHLHFLPLISVAQQDPGRQDVLRRNELQPYDVLYLGDCGDPLEESFVSLGEVYYLPVAMFDTDLATWPDHAEAEEGIRYCTPRRNADRVGRLDDDQLELFLKKMNIFWTRRMQV